MSMIKSWAREYSVQYCEICLRMMGDETKDFCPVTTYDCLFIPQGSRECYCLDEKFSEVMEKKFLETFCRDIISFRKLKRLLTSMGREFLGLTKSISKKDLVGLSNTELIGLYKKYQLSAVRFTYMTWMTYIVAELMSDIATEIIKSRAKQKQNDYLKTVFTPPKKAMLLKLKQEVLKCGKDKKKIYGLYDDYKWVPCVDIIFQPWTKKEFMGAISGFKEEKKRKYGLKHILADMGLSNRERDILIMANFLSYIRDKRDEYRRKGICNILALFDEIEKRIKVGRGNIGYMLEKEIIDALEGKTPDLKEINERKKGFMIYNKNKRQVCVTGNKIKELMKEFGIEETEETGDSVAGIPASKGVVKGAARILTSVKELEKVKKGDILIAVTTHPDYIKAMEKASAFVTDEGGLTSHAAIVAREMGKPCIVGAKTATKTFKDDDMVEVDADKGIIRKL